MYGSELLASGDSSGEWIDILFFTRILFECANFIIVLLCFLKKETCNIHMDLKDKKQCTFRKGVYPHLSKLTFKEFCVLLFWNPVQSTKDTWRCPAKATTAGPRSLGHTDPSRGTGDSVRQWVLHLLIFASFLQFLHVHHAACLHLKGIILQNTSTAERKQLYISLLQT